MKPIGGALALCSLLALVLLLRTTPVTGADVDRADVERILRYLSDDRLAGRGSFTPGNDAAAAFIAAEFASAGLVSAPGSDSIVDRFTVKRIVPESSSVVLNGIPVPREDIIISSDLDRGTWTLSDSFPVYRMGETFDRELFGRKNCLLLIPRVNEKIFQRYHRRSSGPRIIAGDPDPGVLVAILTDSVSARSCVMSFKGRSETPSLANVVGVIPGNRSDEVVLFSAHYDHLGIVRPVDDDSIANGADDNASGTTALISLAKHFAREGKPERTLIFAAFAAEEIGGFGSRHLRASLDPERIVAMVNLEMLGKVSKFGPRSFWMTGYDRGQLGTMLTDELEGSGFRMLPDPYPDQRLFLRSDNAVFARAGVPAHTLSTTPIDVDTTYHTVHDEVSRLDVGHLAETIRGIALGVRGLVDRSQTPARLIIE